MKQPITQSKAWADLQADLGKTAFLKETRDFSFLAIVEDTPVGRYLYVPYGPVYRTEKAFQKALNALVDYAKTMSAFFIRIEPQDPNFASYAPQNAKKSKDLNPKETWVLDLTGNDDDLKAELPSRLLRYHRGAAKKGITIETTHDPDQIRELLTLQRALAAEKKINTYSENYLKTELAQPFATLYLVKQSPVESPAQGTANSEKSAATQGTKQSTPETSDILAAGLVFDDATTRYNLQGAQSDAGRRAHATGILTIQLILDAKAKGLETFDFWGIAPEDAPKNHPWAGFTAFKKTFAGTEVDYAGDYDLVLDPKKYRLYQTLRFANRLRRKF